MRTHVTWTRLAILSVVAALAAGALALHLSTAPLIDCAPASPDRPTISVPDAALDQDDPYADISLRGELVGVEATAGSSTFTVRDTDRGLLTFHEHLGGSVALDLAPGSDVSVTYVRWFSTGSSGSDLAVVDKEGLVFAVQEGAGELGKHPPFSVANVTGRCPGSEYLVPSMLTFSAAGTEASAAAGESATLSVDGRDYLVHTFDASELVNFEVFDPAPQTSYVIARAPE